MSMTNEQREAIELLEGIRDNTWTTKYIMSSDSKKADAVLSLIKEQQEKMENKDKQIDLMADEIIMTKPINCTKTNEFNTEKVYMSKEEVKQYFADKAKMSQ